MKQKTRYFSFILLVAVLLLPLYWTLIGSFLTEEEFILHYGSVFRSPAWFAPRPSAEQYASLLFPEESGYESFTRHFAVSLLSASAMTLLHVLTVPILGFYLAKHDGRLTRFIFFFVVLAMLAPLQVTMTPTLILAKQLKLDNSWWAILLPSAVTPFGIFLTRQFLRALPDELLEAARLDTDSVFTVLRCIVLPESFPAMMTLLMIGFSEFYSMIEQPLILLDPSDHIMPLSVEMNHISRLFPNTVFAASVLFILPCLLLYLLVRKQMIRKMNELTLI